MALIVLEGFGAWMAAFDGQVRAGRSISVGERGLKSFITAVLRLIAISSDRPILSVEKKPGILRRGMTDGLRDYEGHDERRRQPKVSVMGRVLHRKY